METLGRGGGSRETYITKKIKIRTKADIRRKKTYKYWLSLLKSSKKRKQPQTEIIIILTEHVYTVRKKY